VPSYITPSILIMTGAVLSGCSGGSDLFPVTDSGASFAVTEDTLTLSAEAGDVALPLDEGFDRGTFLGAAQTTSANQQRILALSESEATFAGLLINRASGTTVDTYFGRTAPLATAPTGQADLAGTYVGPFVPNADEDFVAFEAYITGDVSLDVDFDAMTLGGAISNREAVLTTQAETDDAPEPFALVDVRLDSVTITQSGEFSGIADTLTGLVDVRTLQTGTYSGLIGGSAENPEVVGQLQLDENSSNPLNIRPAEVGVFATGH